MFGAMFGAMTRRGQVRFLTLLNGFIMTLCVNAPLSARNKEPESEPVWVISWAVFFLFLAVTLLCLARPTKRRDTILTEEEEKDFEEKLGAKRSALIKEEPDEFEDD